MTREPDPTETQIRSLIGFHCTDQDAFVEMVAWLDRTAGRLERLEDDNAKLTKEAAETWDRILFEREQGDAKADEARKQAREERARCQATHGHALHTVGELRVMARRGAKTVRLATIHDLDEGDQQ